MTGLGEYRWEGYSLAEKQRWMREGQGAAAVERGVQVLDALVASSRRSAESLRGALAELGVDWSGAAADSAGVALAATTAGAERILDEASAGRAGLDRYAESFARVSRTIPAPGEASAPLVAAGDLAVVNGLQSDLRAGPVAQRRAELAANAALRAHEQATLDALAAFPEPPVRETVAARSQVASMQSAPGRLPEIVTPRQADPHGDLVVTSRHPRPTMEPPPEARTVSSVVPTTTHAAESSESSGKRSDNGTTAAPPLAPMPPIPPPVAAGDGYRTTPGRPGRLVHPDDGPFGRSAVPAGGAHPGGLLDERAEPRRAGRPEIELPRKAPLIPGLVPPGSLDGPDPRVHSPVRGAPLPPPVDRPLPLLSETAEPAGGDFRRWRGERVGSVEEQNFDDNFRALRSDEFPAVHGLGEGRRRS
ncbi:WXG100 family type VII secretion target [Pseudonocardia spinosispora]|uniref:WXG100 family type VII secretion target n=1 Tax=Pseudonocardia spinosispora TaxID=103441 RepID=UPI000408C235|nr:hypothetical protein [Pseudonocardia spinosispora]